MGRTLSGAEILMESLIAEGVDTVFGYPGGQIINVYDALYQYRDRLRHILIRHEQGAVHAAQGYSRATSRPGVVIVTSGPGATNVITGVADAMVDSTPVVIITGQVSNASLGTDSFQETDVIGMTGPIDKWTYQIRRPEDIAPAVAKAFYLASSGRPGPVVLDFTKDAQKGFAEFNYEKCTYIRSYKPKPEPDEDAVAKAAEMINAAERPLLVFGQGIIIGHAEKQLEAFLEKSGMPAASTLLGLSAIPSDFPNLIGMVGMHGNIAPNMMTQKCDLLLAIGMRFDNRVTGLTSEYARNARIIHVDIDESEIGKLVKADSGILGDASEVLEKLTELVERKNYDKWYALAREYFRIETEKVIDIELHPSDGPVRMGEVVAKVSEKTCNDALIITDVGQNQMAGARYSRFSRSRSFITSGGLGTMGFGLPAAIGAKIGNPERTVCLFVGDGGIQMTMQEFGTVMQEKTPVKIVLLNNNWLGNVRQMQELFFGKRYSETRMINPDYSLIAKAYGIRYIAVDKREELDAAVSGMLSCEEPVLLDVHVMEDEMIYPMIPARKAVDKMLLNSEEWFEDGK